MEACYFRILPIDRSKEAGDRVLNNDIVYIQEDSQKCFLNVSVQNW